MSSLSNDDDEGVNDTELGMSVMGDDSRERRLAELHLSAGDVVGGRYRIVSLIGTSNMGAVFLAQHLELEQEVALKVLLPPFSTDSQVLGRFRREAKLMSKIESDHVARVLDVGQLPSGAPFIAMEYLRGQDLAEILRSEPMGMPIERAISLILQASLGLAATHARGIVHRDIKPSNLLVTKRDDGTEVLKIIDFGVAKVRSTDEALTKTSTILGSPRYMAPEQVTSSRDADARADVWSIAVILQEMLTGKPVFHAEGGGVSWLLVKIMTHEPPHLHDQAPHLPDALGDVLHAAMTKERERRTPNIGAFAEALRPYASLDDQRLIDRALALVGPGIPPPLDLEDEPTTKDMLVNARPPSLPPRDRRSRPSAADPTFITTAWNFDSLTPNRVKAAALIIGGLVLVVMVATIGIVHLNSSTKIPPASSASAASPAVSEVEAPSAPTPSALDAPSASPSPSASTAPNVHPNRTKRR